MRAREFRTRAFLIQNQRIDAEHIPRQPIITRPNKEKSDGKRPRTTNCIITTLPYLIWLNNFSSKS